MADHEQSAPDPDASLVAQARSAPAGDMRAFDELISRHQSTVLTNCRYLTREPTESEDLAQEVFVKAYFGLRSFEGRATFKSWIQRIKLHHCLNFLRARKKAEHVDLDDESLHDASELQVDARADAGLERRDQRARIRAVLDAMPDSLRVALVLRDYDELSYAEIADNLDIGLSATKMRIKRAREEFRERYAELSARAGEGS